MAALNAIPSELYEAARMDGASAWSIVWNIKLPLVRPSVILVTVFTIIGTMPPPQLRDSTRRRARVNPASTRASATSSR